MLSTRKNPRNPGSNEKYMFQSKRFPKSKLRISPDQSANFERHGKILASHLGIIKMHFPGKSQKCTKKRRYDVSVLSSCIHDPIPEWKRSIRLEYSGSRMNSSVSLSYQTRIDEVRSVWYFLDSSALFSQIRTRYWAIPGLQCESTRNCGEDLIHCR
jgi:hypothetical protein